MKSLKFESLKLMTGLRRALRTRHATPRPSRLVWALAAAGVASHSLLASPAQAAAAALPSGMNVVQGSASATRTPNQLTIRNSAGAVLDWQSFSIGIGATVRFEQPSASQQGAEPRGRRQPVADLRHAQQQRRSVVAEPVRRAVRRQRARRRGVAGDVHAQHGQRRLGAPAVSA